MPNRDLRQSGQDIWPVNVDLDFSVAHVNRRALPAGWAQPAAQETSANKPESVVLVDLLGNAAGDVALFMEGRSQSTGTGEQGITLLVNGEPMGEWQVNSLPWSYQEIGSTKSDRCA